MTIRDYQSILSGNTKLFLYIPLQSIVYGILSNEKKILSSKKKSQPTNPRFFHNIFFFVNKYIYSDIYYIPSSSFFYFVRGMLRHTGRKNYKNTE